MILFLFMSPKIAHQGYYILCMAGTESFVFNTLMERKKGWAESSQLYDCH